MDVILKGLKQKRRLLAGDEEFAQLSTKRSLALGEVLSRGDRDIFWDRLQR
jgi:hypothetical protein